MRRIWPFLAFLLAVPAAAQTDAFNGVCGSGGRPALTSGLPSTNTLEGVIPSCTVTVYLTGTLTRATIYKDGIGGTLSNPFTANAFGAAAPGSWLFYAADSVGYDVVMSGGIAPNTFPLPVTLTDLKVGGSGGGGSGGCSVGGIPTTGGIVDGDVTSTNCGTNNRSGDTSDIPAYTSTFGYQNGTNNAATYAVMIGNSNAASLHGEDVVAIGDTVFGSVTGNLSAAIAMGLNPGAHIVNGGANLILLGQGAGNWLDDAGDLIAIGNGAGGGQSGLASQLQNAVFLGDAAGAHASGENMVGLGNGAASEYLPGASDIVGIGNGAASGHVNSGTGLPTSSPHDVIGLGNGAAGGNSANNVIAVGFGALNSNAGNTGTENIAFGDHALTANTSGAHNVVMGGFAGANGWVSRFSVGNSNLTGSNNTWLGDFSGPSTTTQLTNTIAVGYQAQVSASNQTTIGNASITSLKIFGCPTGQSVLDDGSGTCYVPGAGGGVIGSDTQIPYNNAGTMAGSNLTWDGTTLGMTTGKQLFGNGSHDVGSIYDYEFTNAGATLAGTTFENAFEIHYVSNNSVSTVGKTMQAFESDVNPSSSQPMGKFVANSAGANILGSGTFQEARGIDVSAAEIGNGGGDGLFGVDTGVANFGSGTVAWAAGITIQAGQNGGGGALTRLDGLYIYPQLAGVTSHNIYSAGATTHNIFEGDLTVNGVTSTAPITVSGSTHGVVIPAGPAVAGGAGSVIYASDATNGYAEVNENNTGLSRVCTAVNGICPLLYSASGTVQAGAHQVFGSGTLSGGTLAVTLSSSAVYSSSSTYACTASDSTAANAIEVTYASGTSVTFTGTGTDTFRYQCVGN